MKEYIVKADFITEDGDIVAPVIVSELIRCKDCDWFDPKVSWCEFLGIEILNEEKEFCCWADRKEKEA